MSARASAATYPQWNDTFSGLGQPMAGYGKGVFNTYSGAGWQDELWYYDTINGYEYIGSVDGSIYSLYLKGTTLYVGGYFTTIYPAVGSSFSANNIAKVNVSTDTWSAVGGNPGVVPISIVADNSNNIFIGSGNYTSTCLHYDQNLLKKWNGSTWSTVGGGLQTVGNDSPGVYALVTDGTNIFVGGVFLGAANGGTLVTSHNIIRWSTVSNLWTAMGNGVDRGANNGIDCNGNTISIGNADSWVTSLAIYTTNVFAAGNFDDGGGFARFNTSGTEYLWASAADSITDYPFGVGVVVSGSDVYASGSFDWIGSGYANGIAKYSITGNSWSTLDTGLRLYNGSYYRGVGGKLISNNNSIIVNPGDYDYAGSAVAYPARWQTATD